MDRQQQIHQLLFACCTHCPFASWVWDHKRYNRFQVADMYAVLLITFGLAVCANAAMTRISARLVRRRV